MQPTPFHMQSVATPHGWREMSPAWRAHGMPVRRAA